MNNRIQQYYDYSTIRDDLDYQENTVTKSQVSMNCVITFLLIFSFFFGVIVGLALQ